MPTDTDTRLGNRADTLSARREQQRDPRFLVQLARKHTSAAIKKLADLMEDEMTPAAVQARCAEILLDRGYGKAPVAVLIGSDKPGGTEGLTVMERVMALRAASVEKDNTTDLEASEIQEADDGDADVVDIPAAAPEDVIG